MLSYLRALFDRKRCRQFAAGCGRAIAPAIAPPGATPATAGDAELRVFDPSLIDRTVDPCENFYRYSCNGWLKRNPLPADQVAYGRFTESMS